jgi:hypothetical protein
MTGLARPLPVKPRPYYRLSMFLENQYLRASNLRRPFRPGFITSFHSAILTNTEYQLHKIYSRGQELTRRNNSGGLGCHITQCFA